MVFHHHVFQYLKNRPGSNQFILVLRNTIRYLLTIITTYKIIIKDRSSMFYEITFLVQGKPSYLVTLYGVWWLWNIVMQIVFGKMPFYSYDDKKYSFVSHFVRSAPWIHFYFKITFKCDYMSVIMPKLFPCHHTVY